MADRKETLAAVRRILREKWDPRGVADVPEASTEYDSYAPTLVSMLERGSSAKDFEVHLARVETDSMGLAPRPSIWRVAAIAEMLALKEPGSMKGTRFTKLNFGWNAEPNAPEPKVTVQGSDVWLDFLVNPFQFREFSEDETLRLCFRNVVRWRLGETNDEGWYRGQCRFSEDAPAWGEFYEVKGDLKLEAAPDWVELRPPGEHGTRHFLFYLRDETFECTAEDWALQPGLRSGSIAAAGRTR